MHAYCVLRTAEASVASFLDNGSCRLWHNVSDIVWRFALCFAKLTGFLLVQANIVKCHSHGLLDWLPANFNGSTRCPRR